MKTTSPNAAKASSEPGGGCTAAIAASDLTGSTASCSGPPSTTWSVVIDFFTDNQYGCVEDIAVETTLVSLEGGDAGMGKLPTEVWDIILNFLAIGEVDRAILSLGTESAKLIPDDAVNTHVKVLHIHRPSCFKTAHRFQGAEKVNIEFVQLDSTMVLDSVDKIVPLLAGLPKLKEAFILSNPFYTKSRNDRALFDGMIVSFCDAFRDGSLPADLSLPQIESLLSCRGCRKKSECELCRSVCETFPLKCLLKPKLCYSFRKRLPLIAARKDGREFLQSKEPLLELLRRQRVLTQKAYEDLDPDALSDLFSTFIDFKAKDLDTFDAMVQEYGCDPSSLTSEEVAEAFDVSYKFDEVILPASTFERFQVSGLPMIISHVRHSGLHIYDNDLFDKETRAKRNMPEFMWDSSDDEGEELLIG